MGELRSIKLKCPYLKKARAREFTRWWPLFKAYAQQVGFADMLTETKPTELPAVEKESAAVMSGTTEVKPEVKHDDEQKKAIERNAVAVASFYTAFQDLENMDCLTYILESINKEWPTGRSWLVVKELQDEFAPRDLMGKVEQRRELERITMSKFEDPKRLFSRITDVEAKYRDRGCELTEEDKLAVVLTKAPEQYTALIQSFRSQYKRIKGTDEEPSLKEIRKEMHEYRPGEEMTPDIHTKNVTKQLFDRFSAELVS